MKIEEATKMNKIKTLKEDKTKINLHNEMTSIYSYIRPYSSDLNCKYAPLQSGSHKGLFSFFQHYARILLWMNLHTYMESNFR